MALLTYPAKTDVRGRGTARPNVPLPNMPLPNTSRSHFGGRELPDMYGQFPEISPPLPGVPLRGPQDEPRNYALEAQQIPPPAPGGTLAANTLANGPPPPGQNLGPLQQLQQYLWSRRGNMFRNPDGGDAGPLQRLRQGFQASPAAGPLRNLRQNLQAAPPEPMQRLRQYLSSRRGTRLR